ncbi:TetR family transcriptional regulator [uncultured Mitsuokella sp.]|uniref:TetR family transcriptional regulator n=1 Tax=uncultured Mitsuokella sp. TaxID=453120 RepID=UPI0026DC3789|nr:TetR family transcriptional regulator [uncultured Mitsuokella sp.]
MSFQRARKAEQIQERRQEILDAAWDLFVEGGLEMVTFSTIAKRISFTRQTIYTYYRSREEVLLDLLGVHVEKFYDYVRHMFPTDKYITQREFCQRLTTHLLTHKKMLLLFSLHITLEQNSRYENILEFKRIMYEAFPTFCDILRGQCPEEKDEAFCHFCITIMIYIGSIYPLMDQNPLQLKALSEAMGGLEVPSVEETVMSSLLLMTASFRFVGDALAGASEQN